jgi:Icc-related predicted phosphoesterase
MRLLAVSDEVVDRVYDLLPRGHFVGVDMIVGCGDLPYDYLEYMVSILNVDLFYVPGNHDPAYRPWSPSARAEGCTNLDLKTVHVRGMLLAGLGGSIRYRPDGVNQYTQTGAYLRAAQLAPALLRNRARYGRALDILITHSPPYGIHDDPSQAHRGLKAINWLLRWANPRYHLHGHMHRRPRNLQPDVTQLGATSILNVFPYRMIEIADEH